MQLQMQTTATIEMQPSILAGRLLLAKGIQTANNVLSCSRNSWQLMPPPAEVILLQILPLPLITRSYHLQCQGLTDKEERIFHAP